MLECIVNGMPDAFTHTNVTKNQTIVYGAAATLLLLFIIDKKKTQT